jgi:hypothetical protein
VHRLLEYHPFLKRVSFRGALGKKGYWSYFSDSSVEVG